MSKEKGYIGSISNKGQQLVKAPYQQSKPSSGTVHRGEDLRTGKK